MTTTHIDIRQGTDEWQEIRAGRVGGSSAAALLVNGKSGNGLGAGAVTLLYRKAAEFITGQKEETFTTPAMQRGTDLEPLARRRYEDETFQAVQEIGYVSDGDFLGYSPDGFVGDDGLIEIKCPGGAEFVRFADTREIKKEYLAQMQWGMWITGRAWCDFVVYHPDFDPFDLIVVRVFPDPDTHWQFSQQVPKYIAEMERVLNAVAKQKQDV